MLTIRAATETDLPALVQLWHETMILQPLPRVELAPDARDSWIAAAHTWLNDPRCGFFAAERENSLIGYIIGWLQPVPGVFPRQLAVVTEMSIDAHGYQGGTGRALVSALREWCAAAEVKQVVVLSPHFDAVAQAFWRSLGAVEWMDVLWLK